MASAGAFYGCTNLSSVILKTGLFDTDFPKAGLPECFKLVPGKAGCRGQNKIGNVPKAFTKDSVKQCKLECTKSCNCIAMEYNKNTDKCQLSDTCTEEQMYESASVWSAYVNICHPAECTA